MTVEILMATYNGELYIEEQIRSIQSQSYTDWVLRVSDDCSTDHTLDIINRLAATDCRIQILPRIKHFGSASANFAHLMGTSTEKYVMLADQDDVWHPDKVKDFVHAMKEAEGMYQEETPLLVFSDLCVVDKNLQELSPSFFSLTGRNPYHTNLSYLLVQNIVTGCAMAMNRSLVALMQEHGQLGSHDVRMHDWFYALVAAATGHVVYLDKATVNYRQHSTNVMGVGHFSSWRVWKRILLHPRRNMIDRSEKTLAFVKQAEQVYEVIRDNTSAKHLHLLENFIAIPKKRRVPRLMFVFSERIWPNKIVDKINQVLGLLYMRRE